MTVTLSKRLFEDSPSSLTSPPASKKLRVLAPLSEQLSGTCHIKPGVAALGSLQSQHHHLSTARKRRHDGAADGGSGAASPSACAGKRGKRADGRPSTAAASPGTAKSALEALLTCEGLEKDPDLEAEVAYITSRQNPDSVSTAAEEGTPAAGPSTTNTAAVGRPASTSTAPAQDAARSSREKRRDQDQGTGRSHRNNNSSSGGSSNASSRDQVGSRSVARTADAPAGASASAAAAPAEASSSGPAAAEPVGSKLVNLNLMLNPDPAPDPDNKEWQRMFAVLTISGDLPSGRGTARRNAGTPAATATAAEQEGPAVAAAAMPMQEAPCTPVRKEASSSNGAACVETPPRSSFLAGEFNRVQRRNTPPIGAAAGAGAPVFVNTHVPYAACYDSDMAM